MDETVVTGVGMASAAGIGLEENLRNFHLKKSGIGSITRFPMPPKARIDIAGQVPVIPLERFPPELSGRLSEDDLRHDYFRAAVFVTAEAIADSGIAPAIRENPRRTALFVASSLGNLVYVAEGYKEFFTKGQYKVAQLVHGMNSYLPSRLAGIFGIKGPCVFVSSACTSALNAILQAEAMMRTGVIDRAVICGVDVCLEPGTFLLWNRIHVLSQQTADPGAACRPYCRTRDGLVLAEAAGCFVLERSSGAGPRAGRPPYARVLGVGMSNGAPDLLMPTREDLALAMREALASARIEPGKIDLIAGSASGSPHCDHLETEAVRAIFGEAADRIPMFAYKSFLGTTFGAQGVTEGALALCALRDNRVPEVRNIVEPDRRVKANTYYRSEEFQGYDLQRLLFINSGFSGNHMAVVFERPAA